MAGAPEFWSGSAVTPGLIDAERVITRRTPPPPPCCLLSHKTGLGSDDFTFRLWILSIGSGDSGAAARRSAGGRFQLESPSSPSSKHLFAAFISALRNRVSGGGSLTRFQTRSSSGFPSPRAVAGAGCGCHLSRCETAIMERRL